MARLAYILSSSHSGSTLLAMLLGAQPGLCTVGELKATNLGDPERYRCSCGRPIRRCPFWHRVHEAMEERGVQAFDITNAGTDIHGGATGLVRRLLQPLYRGWFLEAVRDTALALAPGWPAHLRETQRRNRALVDSLHAVTGADWVIDSSKQALRLKYLLRIPDMEVKVIRLIRDGRAVALTYTDEWNFADAADPDLRGGGTGMRPAPPRENLAQAANEWKRSNEAADCLTGGLPRSQWMEVRYEALCVDPAGTVGRVCDFLGRSAGAPRLDFKSAEHHVIGNGMRFDKSSEIGLDRRWRTHLAARDLHVFDRVAGRLNREYGYAEPPGEAGARSEVESTESRC